MKKRRYVIIAACLLAAFPAFSKGGKQADDDPANNKPYILIASQSATRNGDDDVLLTKMTEAVAAIGDYTPVKSSVTLPDGQGPTKDTFKADETANSPYYVLTVSRQPANSVDEGTPYILNLYQFETGNLVVSNSYAYQEVDSVDMLTNLSVLFFLVPLPPDPLLEPIDESWKAKRLYVEAKAAPVMRLYSGESTDSAKPLWFMGFTWTAGVEADWQFLYWPDEEIGLAAGAGFNLTYDKPGYYDRDLAGAPGVWFPFFSGEVPAVIKFNWKPRYFSISAFGGLYYFFPFNEAKTEGVPLGLTAGIEAGRIIGPGVLSVYLRYSQDLGTSVLNYSNGYDSTDIKFKRYSFALGLSYRLGFFRRPQKIAMEYLGGW